MIITKYFISNCFHCKHIEQTFINLKRQYDGKKVKFRECFIEGPSELTDKLHLTIFPTVIATSDEGTELWRLEGVILPDELIKTVEGAIKELNE